MNNIAITIRSVFPLNFIFFGKNKRNEIKRKTRQLENFNNPNGLRAVLIEQQQQQNTTVIDMFGSKRITKQTARITTKCEVACQERDQI